MWYVVCGMWYVVCGMWYVVCGMWYVGIVSVLLCFGLFMFDAVFTGIHEDDIYFWTEESTHYIIYSVEEGRCMFFGMFFGIEVPRGRGSCLDFAQVMDSLV